MSQLRHFDTLFDEINKLSEIKEPNYPAYNLEKLKENHFKITIAVAGFSIENLLGFINNLFKCKKNYW